MTRSTRSQSGPGGAEISACRVPHPQPTSKAAITDYLFAHRVFGVLPKDALATLADDTVERMYRKGHHLYHTGDPIGHAIMVESGLLAMTEVDTRGDVHVVQAMYPGDTAGMGAILRDNPWAWTATAVTNVTALLIPRDTFLRLYYRFPELAYQVACELTSLFRRSQRTTLRLTSAPVASRLAALLLEAGRGLAGPRSDRLDVDLPLSHRDLALLLGSTRETISREMARLSRHGAVKVSEHRILLVKPEVLRELADDL